MKEFKEYMLLGLTAVLGCLAWFFKKYDKEHNSMYDFYTKNKDIDIGGDIGKMSSKIKELENGSKAMFNIAMEKNNTNHELVIQSIEHLSQNIKSQNEMFATLVDKNK